jgi:hypothetical protein
MTYAQQFLLMDSNLFRGRVMMATMAAATNVLTEDPGTASHTERAALASEVLLIPTKGVDTFLYAVAANPAIAAAGPDDSLDGDLDYVVASNWTIQAISE